MDYQEHTLLFFKTNNSSVSIQISKSAPDDSYVCFRSKFMAKTWHHFINKFQRNSFLLNMEENVAQ